MGTPHYMAPEQATGSAEIDRRTDIYAVGIILYESVTGRVPFQAETFNQLLFEIALAKIIPARQVVPDLDPAIDSIIMKATARDPAHRFQSCEEFVAALEEWEKSGRAVSLPPEQSIEAIVAASVPRAASLPSSSDLTAVASATNSSSQSSFRAPTGSVAGVPAVTAAEPALRQPTVNTWANNSQADVLPPPGPPVMAATIAGVLLLVGGAIGAYFVLRPSPAPQPAANVAPVATAAATVPAVPAPAPKTEETAPTVMPSTAPAEVKPEKIDPVVPVAKSAAALPKPLAKQAAARPVPQTQEKPKASGTTRKAINFGY
jgi:serine/threonine-protein kinase